MFPLALNESVDSTSAPALPAKTTPPRQSHDIPEDVVSLTCDEFIDEDDTELDDSSEDSDFPLPDTPDTPCQRFKVREVRDNFIMRKDNLIIFTTQTGEPCDKGARMLAEQGRLPRIENATLGRAKLISDKNRYIIALIIKERVSETIGRQVITEAIAALLSVTNSA